MPGAGSAVLNFGAFPGTDVASIAVVGQAGIIATSLVDAQLNISATSDHSEDEHAMLKGSQAIEVAVRRSSIVAGSGFMITGMCQDKSLMWGLINIDWEWV